MREAADIAPSTRAAGGVAGHLRITCRPDALGRSILARKEFKTPIHISKPYWNGNCLLLNLMCPTAGMLAGDRVEVECWVEPNASLILSNPSCLRIHKMMTEESANWSQSFRVRSGGFLECNPEWTIPQADSSFEQSTVLDLEEGAELFFVEALAPGRVAFGEAFAFRRFANRFRFRYAGALASCEKHVIEPRHGTHRNWAFGPISNPFYLSAHMASSRLANDADFFDAAYSMQTADLRIGISELASGPCWNLKILAAEPSAARAALAQLRRNFYQAIARPTPDLRRS